MSTSKVTNMFVFRNMRGITQTQLAIEVGTQQPTISLLETNQVGDAENYQEVMDKVKEILKFPGEVLDLLNPYKHGAYEDPTSNG